MRLSKTHNPDQHSFGVVVNKERGRAFVVVVDFWHHIFVWESRNDYDSLADWDAEWARVWPRRGER